MLTTLRHLPSSGFTLVELAIVMVIIGLLMGGILKGQELIRIASFKKTITMIDSFDSAVMLFRDKYGFLPGDILNADLKIPGCSVGCVGGDQNGIVGNPNTDAYPYQTGTGLPAFETSLFWTHLSLADLLSITPAVDTLPNPKSPVGGMFSIYHRAGVHGYSIKTPTMVGGVGVLTPAEAMDFDSAIDGAANPSQGMVMSNGVAGCNIASNVYDRNGIGLCRMLFTAKF